MSDDIINWSEAMQQCGDDEEFLRELLDDLRTEAQAQLTNIDGIIQNPQATPFHQIMRAAHVVKGAAANLMCEQLRLASKHLEDAARAVHENGETQAPAPMQQHVQQCILDMKQAFANYANVLQAKGI